MKRMKRPSQVALETQGSKIALLKMEGMTTTQIAKETNLTRKTVKVVLDKPSVRQMMMNALTENKFTLSMLAKKNIDMLSAVRYAFVGGEYKKLDDNIAQIAAMKELNSIYGVHAPKQLDVRASATEASLKDLVDQADAALEEYGMATEQPASFTGSGSAE